jgi:ATP-binding cassette subfamily F protein uup
MLRPADILILDEPTNDLDIPTLEVLEQSLLEFPGAVLLVTHDRYLMDRICEQIIFLPGDGSVKVFADTQQLSNWQETRLVSPEQPAQVAPKQHKLKREQLKLLRKAAAKTERDLEKADLRKAELERGFSTGPRRSCSEHF